MNLRVELIGWMALQATRIDLGGAEHDVRRGPITAGRPGFVGDVLI